MGTTSSSPATSPPKARRRRRGLRLALGTGGLALLLTSLIGVLHLPFAAPIAARIFPSACPVRRGTPEQIDRAHALGTAALRSAGTSRAPVRPALVFRLDETRRSDVESWAGRHGISCDSIGGNGNLQRCSKVPAPAVGQADDLGMLEEVTFEFQTSGELVNLQTLRRRLSPVHAARAVGSLAARAAAALGPPSSSGGEPTAAHLSRGFLASYVAVHAFADYRATVSATNLAPTGIMVREEYFSAR
jgi:hypothetical protein